jgi:hypothetical protein
MTSLKVPGRPWSMIGIDFVVKLPILGGFDSILVIMDHFSKGVHLSAAQESWKAEDFAFAFFNCFIRHHGLPDKNISDRGSIFFSKFWKEVQRLLQVCPAPSTAWHPRMDGVVVIHCKNFSFFLSFYIFLFFSHRDSISREGNLKIGFYGKI